jgi:hypothetical protein
MTATSMGRKEPLFFTLFSYYGTIKVDRGVGKNKGDIIVLEELFVHERHTQLGMERSLIV